MNLTEFVKELSNTRNEWAELSYGLRKTVQRGVHCPITAVCMRMKNVHFDVTDFEEAAAELNLSPELAQRIVDAADGFEGRLHSRLLRAVGLK